MLFHIVHDTSEKGFENSTETLSGTLQSIRNQCRVSSLDDVLMATCVA